MLFSERLRGTAPALAKAMHNADYALRYYTGSRVEIAIVEGKRSYSRQLSLYAQGRWKPGPIVTHTLSKSKHLTGRAVDITLGVDGKAIAQNSIPSDWWNYLFYLLRFYMPEITWGGKWQWKDKPHYET